MHGLSSLVRPRRIVAALATFGLVGIGSVALASAASAHSNSVSGVAACQTDGTFTITWTVFNDFNQTETATEVSASAGGTVSPKSVRIAASPSIKSESTGTFAETGVAGTVTSATLGITGRWSDGTIQRGVSGAATGMTSGCTPTTGGSPTPTPTPTPTVTPTPTPTVTPTGSASSGITAVTSGCHTLTYTFDNTAGTKAVTYDVFVSTDGGVTYPTTPLASTTVAAGSVGTLTVGGTGVAQVEIGGTPQAGSQFGFSGILCPTGGGIPVTGTSPSASPTAGATGSIASVCPTVKGTTGTYTVTLTNTSSADAIFDVLENGRLVSTSGTVAAGGTYTYPGTLTAGEKVTVTAASRASTSQVFSSVAISGTSSIVCSAVLGVTVNKPPAVKPPTGVQPVTVTKPTLPFTGLPAVPFAIAGLGLLLAGASMLVMSRRRGDQI